jgi:hypothetical protein
MSATAFTILSGVVLLVVLGIAGWYARGRRGDDGDEPEKRRPPTNSPEE